jgi:hypothetical protein
VTKIQGDQKNEEARKKDQRRWEQDRSFRKAMRNNPIRLLPLREMLNEMQNKVKLQVGNPVEASELGRTLQLLTASGYLDKDRKESS